LFCSEQCHLAECASYRSSTLLSVSSIFNAFITSDYHHFLSAFICY
jgi:hypothetical protein